MRNSHPLMARNGQEFTFIVHGGVGRVGTVIRTMRRELGVRGLVSLILVITAALGLVSAVLNPANPPTVSFHSPTATHTGYLSVSYTGVYHYVDAHPLCAISFPPCWTPDEIVFYLVTANETVRLIFYCEFGLEYCTHADQLPFHDGARIYVKGTLLVPSDWPTNQFEPSLQFNGDFYVFQYKALAD